MINALGILVKSRIVDDRWSISFSASDESCKQKFGILDINWLTIKIPKALDNLQSHHFGPVQQTWVFAMVLLIVWTILNSESTSIVRHEFGCSILQVVNGYELCACGEKQEQNIILLTVCECTFICVVICICSAIACVIIPTSQLNISTINTRPAYDHQRLAKEILPNAVSQPWSLHPFCAYLCRLRPK